MTTFKVNFCNIRGLRANYYAVRNHIFLERLHNATWLRHSNETSSEGRYVEIFSEQNLLTQLVQGPTHILDVAKQAANTLDLFFTSHPEKYSIEVFAPLGSSDHSLISSTFSSTKQVSKEKLPKRKIWFYKRANWDGLNIFFKNYGWSQCFNVADIDFAADSISFVITEGMEEYIPSRVQTIKPKNNVWYDTNCEAVIKIKNLEHRHFLMNPTEKID